MLGSSDPVAWTLHHCVVKERRDGGVRRPRPSAKAKLNDSERKTDIKGNGGGTLNTTENKLH